MKKISALIMLIATAILSGVALNKFLNWAGKQEDFFDFDLNEDIDHEEIQITYINSIGPSNYLDIWHTGAIEINSQLFISRPFKGGMLPKVANNPVRALKPSQGIFMAYSRKQLRCENGVSYRRSTFFALIALYVRIVLYYM